MKLSIVDWRITASCNNACPFCYASAPLPMMDEHDVQKCIDVLDESECEAVCVSGGEPLLYVGTPSVIKRLHSAGISVFLSTNGTHYLANRGEIEPYIAKLSVPLDGFDEASNSVNGRIPDSFETVVQVLEHYTKTNHAFALKVATVLSRKNMDIEHFAKMYELLQRYSIDVWKIYQFVPEGRGLEHESEYAYSEAEYRRFLAAIADMLQSQETPAQFQTMFADRKGRDAAYFILQPDGSVMVPVDNGAAIEEKVVGSLLSDDISDLTTRWADIAKDMNFIANFEKRNIQRPLHKSHVDELDRSILYRVDREPLAEPAQIGADLGLDPREVAARIDKLYAIRAIKHIMPIINVAQFGLDVYLVNLYFKRGAGIDPSRVAEILAHHPDIAWVAECYDWDDETSDLIFRVAIFARNNFALSKVLGALRSIFAESMYRYETDIVPDKHVCGQRYLVDTTGHGGLDGSHISLSHETRTKLSKDEFLVLSQMKGMERLTIENLSRATALDPKKVVRLIDGLRERLVINKFQAVLDPSVLGYRCYMFFIKFSALETKDAFEKYVKAFVNVTHINTLNTGMWDIDIEIQVPSADDCFAFWNRIEGDWCDSILSKKVIRIEREYKFQFLNDVMIDALKENTKRPWLGA